MVAGFRPDGALDDWVHRMEITAGSLVVRLLNDTNYTPGSADNTHVYSRVYDLTEWAYRPSSKHVVICIEPDELEHSCILLGESGATGIHEHSAVVVGLRCFVAVGDAICSLSLPDLKLEWSTKVDEITCFGIYYSRDHDCLLSHGELEIARVSLSGEIAWSKGGKDIFTGCFQLAKDHVEVVDFNRHIHRFDIVG